MTPDFVRGPGWIGGGLVLAVVVAHVAAIALAWTWWIRHR